MFVNAYNFTKHTKKNKKQQSRNWGRPSQIYKNTRKCFITTHTMYCMVMEYWMYILIRTSFLLYNNNMKRFFQKNLFRAANEWFKSFYCMFYCFGTWVILEWQSRTAYLVWVMMVKKLKFLLVILVLWYYLNRWWLVGVDQFYFEHPINQVSILALCVFSLRWVSETLSNQCVIFVIFISAWQEVIDANMMGPIH